MPVGNHRQMESGLSKHYVQKDLSALGRLLPVRRRLNSFIGDGWTTNYKPS